MGFFSFETAWRTLQGYEVMHRLKVRTDSWRRKGDSRKQAADIASLFGVAVSADKKLERSVISIFHDSLCNTTLFHDATSFSSKYAKVFRR
jgi:hypothetical protein